MDMVLIQWHDTYSKTEWAAPDEIGRAKPILCSTIGYVRKRDKQKITVSHTVTSDGDGDYTTIPVGCIVAMKALKEGARYV